MSKNQQWLLTKQLQAQGWSEKKVTSAINKMSIKEQAKLSLLSIRAVGVVKFRQEFIKGFEQEFADAVAEIRRELNITEDLEARKRKIQELTKNLK
jgi:hypothetical protein